MSKKKQTQLFDPQTWPVHIQSENDPLLAQGEVSKKKALGECHVIVVNQPKNDYLQCQDRDLCFFITKENLAAMSSSAPAESGVLYTSSCHISYRCCPSFVT